MDCDSIRVWIYLCCFGLWICIGDWSEVDFFLLEVCWFIGSDIVFILMVYYYFLKGLYYFELKFDMV